MKKWLALILILFGEHDKTDSYIDETGENISLNPGRAMGGSTWEQDQEQETLFGGTSLMTKVVREHVEALYRKLSESMDQSSEAFHLDYFELQDGKLLQRQEHALNDQRREAEIGWCYRGDIGQGRTSQFRFRHI